MIQRYVLLHCFFIACSSTIQAASINWVAKSPNHDMNNPSNWNPNTIPASEDSAIFNSNISGIDTNPTENSAPFSVSTFNFPSQASLFDFKFNNQTLTFTGSGITGFRTNPTITVDNSNNSSFPGDLVNFSGGIGSSGSSFITSTNHSNLTGNLSGVGVGPINSNFHCNGAFSISSNGNIAASNVGDDSTIGTGNNGTSNTGASQLKFDQSLTAGNDVKVSVTNYGTFSGSNTVQGNAVAIINGSQLISSGSFQAGNNFNCEVQNTGNDSCSGIGLSNIGQVNAAQINLQTDASFGDECTISVSNTGSNSSQTTSFPDFIGYLNDQQIFIGNTLHAGNKFTLSATNTGTDSSHGYGGYQIAVINSNSGTTGNQILLQQGCSLGNHATISAINSGTSSGTNTNGGSNVGGMNLQQIAIGDSTTPGAYALVAGDYFNLSASNSGSDSSHGIGSNSTGNVSTDQITVFTATSLGKNAKITITNSGNYSGNASSTYVNVGSTGGCQLNCIGSVSAGDNFTLSASNSGTNTSSGIGNYFVGDLITGQQISFQDNLILGHKASITISNSGSNSSSTTSNNQVGSFMGYGKQLLSKNLFQTGDDFYLEITNSGYDNSSGPGGNFVGFMNNNTVDHSASQIHLSEGATFGERASIKISNTGTYEGSNTTTSNAIGTLAGQQLYSVKDFKAGNNFALTVSNSGTDNASGQNYNNIGTVGLSQVQFDGACLLGNHALIDLTNIGTCRDTTGIENYMGVINGSQMLVNGNFTAGSALNISAKNKLINEGNPNNYVGYLSASQLVFAQSCSFNDESIINAFNSGTIVGSQIVFGQGFNIESGSVTIKAVNDGSLGAFGIDIQGANEGGNANIVLGNSSLNIGTTLSSFTIGSLSGDSACIVQSQPQLIINTPSSIDTEFAGVIQNYPSTTSTLMKTGSGTQKLSGINTYSGLTTIQEGVLVSNGSLGGDVLINSLGTLKGNGTITGTVTNMGVVSPGESIGTLAVGNYVNSGGNYNVEVNQSGQSDLINASGEATLSGGTVVVSSSDGTFKFQQPYTILTATEGVGGTFTNATSSAFIEPKLTYDPHNVYLTVQAALINAAEKCNQYGVATNLDNITNPNESQTLLIGTIANLPLASAQKSLESLSGFQYTDDVPVTNISVSRFLRRLYDPLRSLVTGNNCSSACDDYSAWLETGYGYSNLFRNNLNNLNINSYQITGGIQKTLWSEFTLGIAGSYEYNNVRYLSAAGDRKSTFASLYGLYRPCKFYGLFDMVYGHSSNKLIRRIDVGSLEYKAHSKPNFNLLTFYGEAGFDFNCDCILIQPFLGIQIGKNWRGKINENQTDGYRLLIKKHDWTTTSSRLGLHLSTCNLCGCTDASFDIAWNQQWSSRKNATVGRFKEFGDAFPICGNKLDNHSFDCALTFTSCLCNSLNGFLELEGEMWRHAITFNVVCGIQYAW